MQSKAERFKKWRGEKFSAEQDAFNTAAFIEEYIDSVESLATIKADFASLSSSKYQEFDKFNRRSLGIVLFCKLLLDESIDKIPQNAPNETAIKERILLAEISELLGGVYDDYTKDAAQRLTRLIAKTKECLELNTQQLHNPQQAKRISFGLYLILSNINLAVSGLNFLKKGLLGRIINIETLTKDVQFLLQKTEFKVNQINGLIPATLVDNNKKITGNQAIQEAFNMRFLKLLNSNNEEGRRFTLVNAAITEVTDNLTCLTNARAEQAAIAVKIVMINQLLQAALENKKKITGRLYFTDFIETHYREFEILINSLRNYRKTEFKEKIESLKSANISSTLLSLLSWGTTPGTIIFRAITPQVIQDRITNSSPSTLDSECKNDLITYTKQCLATLNQELNAKDDEIKSLTSRLAGGNDNLEEMIRAESSENLLSLVKPYESANAVIQKYWLTSIRVNNNVSHLKVLKGASPVFTQFIKVHDGFLVQLSNLFSFISPIFKSKTAKMVDEVKDLESKITRFEQNYYNQIKEYTTELDRQELSPEIKKKLKELVHFDPATLNTTAKPKEISREQVQSLISNLTQLFSSTIKIPVTATAPHSHTRRTA